MSNALTGKQIREKRKRLKLSVEQLSEQLAISKDNLYKWEKGTRITDVEAYLKLEKWLTGEMENIPLQNGSVSKNATVSDFKADYGHDFSARAIFNLSESNRLIAESNASLAKSNELLSHKVESIARGSEEIAQAVAAQLAAVRDLLMEQSLRSGAYSSPLAFEKAYNKKADEFLKKTKEGGTLDGAGKKNKVKS